MKWRPWIQGICPKETWRCTSRTTSRIFWMLPSRLAISARASSSCRMSPSSKNSRIKPQKYSKRLDKFITLLRVRDIWRTKTRMHFRLIIRRRPPHWIQYWNGQLIDRQIADTKAPVILGLIRTTGSRACGSRIRAVREAVLAWISVSCPKFKKRIRNLLKGRCWRSRSNCNCVVIQY